MFNQCEQFANFYKALNLMMDLHVGGEFAYIINHDFRMSE